MIEEHVQDSTHVLGQRIGLSVLAIENNSNTLICTTNGMSGQVSVAPYSQCRAVVWNKERFEFLILSSVLVLSHPFSVIFV